MVNVPGRPRLFVSTGCSSSDVVLAPVLAELIRRKAVGQITAVGGEPLRDLGAHLLYDSTPLSSIGTTNGIRVFCRMGLQLIGKLREIKASFRDDPPDLVVLVDNAGINFRILALARKFGIPVLYYVPPELWSVWSIELSAVVRAKPRIAAIFASQAEEYKRLGLEAEWVGHPILDIVQSYRQAPTKLEGPPLISLFPGSRRHEILSLLPRMKDAVVQIQKSEPDAKFILCCANPMAQKLIQDRVKSWPAAVQLRFRETYKTLSQSHLALACSGTVTLEAALLGVPTIAMYRINGFLDNLMRVLALPLAKYPFFSLPNVIAGRAILPELGNRAVNGQRIAAEAKRLLRDSGARQKMIDDLQSIRPMLGPIGAVHRTADMIEAALSRSAGHLVADKAA